MSKKTFFITVTVSVYDADDRLRLLAEEGTERTFDADELFASRMCRNVVANEIRAALKDAPYGAINAAIVGEVFSR